MEEQDRKKQKHLLNTIASSDRISALPDSLLLHILSFLPMNYVVPTSLLSRRWRHLWTSIPTLNFDEKELDERVQTSEFISECLVLHECPKLQKLFRLHFNLKDRDSSHIDCWLKFAKNRAVEEIDVDFADGYLDKFLDESNLYTIPSCLLNCEAVRVLMLAGCCLKLPSAFCFRSLKKIILTKVILFELDTAGCPLLESLTISYCNYAHPLNIYAPSQVLGDITILDDYDVRGIQDNELVIHAPHLLSIRISGCMRSHYRLINLISLVDATLDFNYMCWLKNYDTDVITLMKLLKCVSPAKTIKLCRWCIQILSFSELQGLETPMLNVTSLELDTKCHQLELLGLTCLLRNFSRLKSLAINVSKYKKDADIWRFLPNSNYVLDLQRYFLSVLRALVDQTNLETININNLLGSTYHNLHGNPPIESSEVLKIAEMEMVMVQLLFRFCFFLKKIVIQTTKDINFDKRSDLLLCLARELLAIPRSSRFAETYFS